MCIRDSQVRDHCRGAPVVPGCMSPGDLEFKDSPANRTKTALGFGLPIRGQITRIPQRQMHLFVEVLAELDVYKRQGIDRRVEQLVVDGVVEVAEHVVVGPPGENRPQHWEVATNETVRARRNGWG